MECSSYIQQTVFNHSDTQMQTYIEKICQLASFSKFATDGRLFKRYLDIRAKLIPPKFDVDRSNLSTNDSLNENKTVNNISQFPNFERLEIKYDNCSEFRYEYIFDFFIYWTLMKLMDSKSNFNVMLLFLDPKIYPDYRY